MGHSGILWVIVDLSESGLFRGASHLSLDTKGRMTVPARYKDSLLESCDGNLIMTVDVMDKCLMLYPLPVWLGVEADLSKLPSTNKSARRIKRLLIGYATDVTMDKNGRLLLPPALREFAELDKQIVLIGQGSKFEIWDEAHWKECTQQWLQEEGEKDDLIGDLESLSF